MKPLSNSFVISGSCCFLFRLLMKWVVLLPEQCGLKCPHYFLSRVSQGHRPSFCDRSSSIICRSASVVNIHGTTHKDCRAMLLFLAFFSIAFRKRCYHLYLDFKPMQSLHSRTTSVPSRWHCFIETGRDRHKTGQARNASAFKAREQT